MTAAARKREQLERKVKVFYTSIDISRPLPHKRFTTKHGPDFAMIVTVKAARRLFTYRHPQHAVGLTKFQKLRPKNVRKMGSVEAQTCLCLHCQNLCYKIDVLNRHLSDANKLPPVSRLLDLIVCSKDSKWNHLSCIKGNCTACADSVQPVTRRCSDVLGKEVHWVHWERQPDSETGKVKLDVHPKDGTILDLLNEMESDLKTPVRGTSFAEHLFTAYWQQYQYKFVINTLMPGEVLLVEDFAENRKATFSAEVKSAHFGKAQITLHPIVAYFKDSNYQLVRHSLMYISNDIQHDYHVVKSFTERAISYLQEETDINSVIIFSDGCASQYKGKGTFANLSLMSQINVQRAFFGSDHGKGEADGETGVLSQAMGRAVRSGTNISSAVGLYEWARSCMTKEGGLHRRSFYYVPQHEILRNRPQTNVATVPGTRKMHQIVRVDNYLIKSRQLACFCCACRADNTSKCINSAHVGDYTTHKLKLKANNVSESEEASDLQQLTWTAEQPEE